MDESRKPVRDTIRMRVSTNKIKTKIKVFIEFIANLKCDTFNGLIISGKVYKMDGQLEDNRCTEVRLLNLEEFERVLKIAENKKSIEKLVKLRKLSVGNGQLHNMGSDTYKQKIKLLRKNGKEYEESFIVKEVPSHPLVRSHLLKQGLYEREVKYYTEVFPLMEELITDAGINMEKLWPECISCDPNQYVILEDLTRSGYVVHPLDKLMDLEHSLLCTTAIARLHALSIILVERGLLNESPVLKQSYVGRKSGSIATAMKAHFSSLYNLFSQWGTEWKNLGKQLVDNADALLVKYSNICQPSSTSLNVLNHGDLWLGNIMFKYCKITGKPTGIKLIDYQLSHFTSYALDLHYILRISSTDDIYKRHYQQLIAIYRDMVLNTFKQFNFQPTKPFPSLEEINKEIDCKKLYPLMVSVYISPRMYEKTRNAMTKELSVFQDKNLIEKLMDIDEYRIRIKEIFEPYLGCNLLA